MSEKKDFKRLSKSVKPINYKITLKPDLEAFTFEGKEEIDIELKKECTKITVNSVDIKVTTATVSSEQQVVKASEIRYNEDAETVTFKFPNTLFAGVAKLSLEFTGVLNDKMKGFYRSKYTSLSGEERHMAVTQFEATDARRAFPCWDEPAVKATFDIVIIARKDRVVLSNMDVKSQGDYAEDTTLQEVAFNTTPIMSTYLVAIVVGEFDFIEESLDNGILARVYTPLGKTEQGRFALEITAKTLPFYEEYFGIKYPLPKIDLIAIPDFAAGAMENWGLVTYRETALLVDENETSAASRQWVAIVVGHELAHQWFGNLTTMEWWTHLWLNEGFASWIEYLSVDYCCPEYDIWTQFVTNDFARALELDALSNSHPIEVKVGHPSEIDEIFDAISYSKGSCIIRMLHDYLGEKDFKCGLNKYLTKYQYANGATEDLWDSLEEASSKPVGQVMTTWTKQMGFPVLSVSAEYSGTKCILKVAQKKFTADGSPDPNNQRWFVPINIATSNNIKHKTLMSDPDMVIFLDNVPSDAWVKINPGQIGFYRTCYSPDMITKLVPGIESLSPVDRLGIENDLFALSVAGVSRTIDFLNILKGYKNELNYTVWSDINSNISSLGIIIQNTNYFKSFQDFVIRLYKPISEKLGWDPKPEDDHLTALLRCLILSRLGKYGDPDVLREGQRRFKAHVEGTETINADIRSAVYSMVAQHGDEETIDQLITLYRKTTHMEEQRRIMINMGASDKRELIIKCLDFAISDEVRSQDTVFAISGNTGSLLGRQMVWDFVKKNWDILNKRYEGGFLLTRLISSTTENFATIEAAEDVKAFFEEHKAPAGERAVKQSIENIHLNHAWLDREKDNIEKWLTEN